MGSYCGEGISGCQGMQEPNFQLLLWPTVRLRFLVALPASSGDVGGYVGPMHNWHRKCRVLASLHLCVARSTELQVGGKPDFLERVVSGWMLPVITTSSRGKPGPYHRHYLDQSQALGWLVEGAHNAALNPKRWCRRIQPRPDAMRPLKLSGHVGAEPCACASSSQDARAGLRPQHRAGHP